MEITGALQGGFVSAAVARGGEHIEIPVVFIKVGSQHRFGTFFSAFSKPSIMIRFCCLLFRGHGWVWQGRTPASLQEGRGAVRVRGFCHKLLVVFGAAPYVSESTCVTVVGAIFACLSCCQCGRGGGGGDL